MLASGVMKRQTAAESALELPFAKVGIPYNYFKRKINHCILSAWQDDWNGEIANMLHSTKPVLGDWQSSYRRCMMDEVVFCPHRWYTFDPSPILTSAIILLKKGKIYLVEWMWWNHLDSTPH